jgi:hypothetical protein
MHSIIKRCRQVELMRIDDADQIIRGLMSEASLEKMTLRLFFLDQTRNIINIIQITPMHSDESVVDPQARD